MFNLFRKDRFVSKKVYKFTVLFTLDNGTTKIIEFENYTIYSWIDFQEYEITPLIHDMKIKDFKLLDKSIKKIYYKEGNCPLQRFFSTEEILNNHKKTIDRIK